MLSKRRCVHEASDKAQTATRGLYLLLGGDLLDVLDLGAVALRLDLVLDLLGEVVRRPGSSGDLRIHKVCGNRQYKRDESKTLTTYG